MSSMSIERNDGALFVRGRRPYVPSAEDLESGLKLRKTIIIHDRLPGLLENLTTTLSIFDVMDSRMEEHDPNLRKSICWNHVQMFIENVKKPYGVIKTAKDSATIESYWDIWLALRSLTTPYHSRRFARYVNGQWREVHDAEAEDWYLKQWKTMQTAMGGCLSILRVALPAPWIAIGFDLERRAGTKPLFVLYDSAAFTESLLPTDQYSCELDLSALESRFKSTGWQLRTWEVDSKHDNWETLDGAFTDHRLPKSVYEAYSEDWLRAVTDLKAEGDLAVCLLSHGSVRGLSGMLFAHSLLDELIRA
ncbi:hypothetical protein QFC20_004592 [Naganishia adeliensis]|uniref:Uncharacterized protein n=1 Tax=Naganishia adeliensis TaxID=92952 RepID=A0ACC2VZJ9_9TREE|nr:hypothetical protein QFC20_004592 [Naganishia adeliensis]